MSEPRPSLLLVDDIQTNLNGLAERLRERLPGCEITAWQPNNEEGSPAEAFNRYVGEDTVLVVTDYDLSTTVKGLFGLSIVGWCQNRAIPVGEYSRANLTALPHEPNLFELRVPNDEGMAVDFVASAFMGFREMRSKVNDNPQLIEEGGSLSWVLSKLLGHPQLESQFSAYMSRLNSANASLLETLKTAVEGGKKPDDEFKKRLLSYVLGHVMVNSVLKYPGPILTKEVLCAYLTTTTAAFQGVRELFEGARYDGPFSEGRDLYWRDEIDKCLDDLGGELKSEDMESFGDYNREVTEQAMGRQLLAHGCERCDGTKGGFWCPFTMRAICERAECSVPGSSWIPAGAYLCRVERDFFDEWSPILGL